MEPVPPQWLNDTTANLVWGTNWINGIREISVLRSQKAIERKQSLIRRGGLLYFGALRELFIIALAVGFVTTSLWQANSLLNMHLSSQASDTAHTDILPVINLALDSKNLTLFTRAITGKLSQISLETGKLTSRPIPNDSVAVAMSSHASTIAVLEEWAEDRRIHYRVDIIKDDQIVVSEELKLELYSDASVYISLDGNVVMGFSGEGKGVGWDLTKSSTRRWTIDVGPINHMNCLSPDGQRLFVTSKIGPPFICDSQSGETRIPLNHVARASQCVAWSADGTRLAVGDLSGGVHVFNALNGQRIWHEKIKLEFARSVAFSSDGCKLAVGGFDEIIRVWNLSEPDLQPVQLKGQIGTIRSLVFNASNENLVSGSYNGTILEWSLANQNCVRKFQ